MSTCTHGRVVAARSLRQQPADHNGPAARIPNHQQCRNRNSCKSCRSALWLLALSVVVPGCAIDLHHSPLARLPRPWRLTGPFQHLSLTPITSRSPNRPELARYKRADTNEGKATGRFDDRKWHLDLGFRTGYTKLGSTKQTLDRRLDLPLKLDVLGMFHKPDTALDRRSNFNLNTIYLGLGFQQSDWLVWTFYAGGGAAKDSDHQRYLNINLDVEFNYTHVYTGVQLELYPWGLPDYLNNLDFYQRLRASRPYVITGFETGFVDAGGRGDYSIAPFKIYEDEVNIRDWLFSYLLGIGWAVPLDDSWSLNLSGHYAFHFYRPDEYNTWNIVSMLRYRF